MAKFATALQWTTASWARMIDNPDEDLTTGRHVAVDVFDNDLDHAVRPLDIPAGLITAFIGGPYFLYLLVKAIR